MMNRSHFCPHIPTSAFLFIFSLFPLSTRSLSPLCKSLLTWWLQFSEAVISSPRHSDVMCAGNDDAWPYVYCVSIRPPVFQKIIEHFIFYYRPLQISTAKWLFFYCYCFIVIIKIASGPFHSVVIFYSALLDRCFLFSKFHYLGVLSFACSSLQRQYFLLSQQHVY